MRFLFLALIAFLVLIFGFTFVAQNPQQVNLDYYFGLHFKGSIALLIFLSIGVGVAIGYLTLGWQILRMRRALNKAYRASKQGYDEKAFTKMPDTPRN